MIAHAVLYLATPEDRSAALLPVAGRPVAFRAVIAAIRAGARRVALPSLFRGTLLETAVAASPAARRAVAWLDTQPLPSGPALLLPAAALAPAAAIGRLLQDGAGAVLEESRDDGAPTLVAEADLVADAAEALASGAPLGDALQQAVKDRRARLVRGDAWYVRVRGQRSAAEAERRLYDALASPIDTALDRAVHRRLSRPLSRRAVAWRVPPNGITLASLGLGLAAVACFWGATPSSALAGLALYVSAVVLDHADGEVARLTLAESAIGEWLDVAVDTLIHALLVAAMGITAQMVAGAGAVSGAVAALGVVASAAVAKARPRPARRDGVERALERLGARDGFYGMVLAFIALLALWPAALPALVAVVAVGANVYWVARLSWGRRRAGA